jgi:integrase
MPRKTYDRGLYLRPDSQIWWADYTDEHGRRVRRSTGTKDRAEAERVLKVWRKTVEHVRRTGTEPPRPIEDLLLAYLTGPSTAKRSHETDLHRSKSLLRHLKERDLRELSPKDITAYKAARRDEGASDSTTNRELALLSHAINWACLELEWRVPNPVKGRLTTEPEGRVRWITPEEAERLITAAGQARKLAGLDDFVVVALHTGMRKGELLGLEWSRVDLQGRTIQLESIHTKAGKRRRIPLSERAREALLRRWAVRGSSPWVFCWPTGEPWRDIRGAFERACMDAGIENFHIHDLRHTCASWLVMSGAPIYEVRDLLGHSTVMMTERYSHLAPEALRLTVSRLDQLTEAEHERNAKTNS